MAAAFSATGWAGGAKYAKSKELPIPEGYEVSSAAFVASAEIEDGDPPNGGVTVGGDVRLWQMILQGNKGPTAATISSSRRRSPVRPSP